MEKAPPTLFFLQKQRDEGGGPHLRWPLGEDGLQEVDADEEDVAEEG